MSLGISNMAGSALTTFSLLLLLSVVQGLPDVEVIPYETIEAAVGQDIDLPCTIKTITNIKIVNVEWSRKNNNNSENTKLLVYNSNYGVYPNQPDISMEIENNDAKKLKGFHLHLPAVAKWQSGTYICHITVFPFGSFQSETELQIKDVKIMCDMESTIQVLSGENVTVNCRGPPNAQYRWTKNKKLVSEKESLELWWVTEAQAGVYTLTVSTGKIRPHKDFTITVTTSLTTDLVTVSPESNVTEDASTDSSDSSFTTAPTPGLSTAGTTVTWTMSIGTNGTDDNQSPANVTITTEFVNPFTNYTDANVTLSPATHTDPYLLLNSTTLSYGSTVFRATQEMTTDETRNEATQHAVTPEDLFSNGTEESGNITKNYGNGNVVEATARSHLLVLSLVLMLVLITVAGFLYRRHVIKKRMDLPPPFSPPPPPVYKYTAAKCHETSINSFPISRCNSVATNIHKV